MTMNVIDPIVASIANLLWSSKSSYYGGELIAQLMSPLYHYIAKLRNAAGRNK